MHIGPSQLSLCLRLDTEQALDDHVIYFSQHVRIINTKFLQMCAKSCHAPFESTIAFLWVIVLNEIVVFLIYRIVC